MIGVRGVALFFGVIFGVLMSWGQFVNPDRIQEMLLLEDLYLYVMMASAMAVGFLGIRLLRRAGRRALVTGERIQWETERPRARHIVGSAIFGTGWAVAASCPAPIAAQLGQGVAWSLFTIAGVLIGIELYLRRSERATAAALSESTSEARIGAPDPAS